MKHEERLDKISDADLIAGLRSLVKEQNVLTARLLDYIAEVDRRKLYLGRACSSMFVYWCERLGLSEGSAYKRIHAARAARRFPVLLSMIERGEMHLKGVTLLAPHLTEENHGELLARARGKSARAIETLVHEISPRPEKPSRIAQVSSRATPGGRSALAGEDRKHTAAPAAAGLPQAAGAGEAAGEGRRESHAARQASSPEASSIGAAAGAGSSCEVRPAARAEGAFQPSGEPRPAAPASQPWPASEPSAPRRYEIRVTVGEETYADLRQLQDLMAHQVRDGEPAEIIARALALLLERTLAKKVAISPHAGDRRKRKKGASGKPASRDPAARSRHIPHEVRRKVWLRDEGRCAFRDERGRRCQSRRRLEFHHLDNWARGADHDPDRIELRCQPHNLYQAELDYGAAFIRARRSRGNARERVATYLPTFPGGRRPRRARYSSCGSPGICPARR